MRYNPERDFVAELRERLNQIKESDKPEVKYKEEIIIPEAMQAPEGELYSVFKRSNKGYSHKLFISIPLTEAMFLTKLMNEREIVKREKMSNFPEEVFFFDYVQVNSDAEDPYWNPYKVMLDN